MEGDYVQKLNLIISDLLYSYEEDNLIEYLYSKLDTDDKLQLSVCNIKSNIILINNDDDGNKYVIHGSANLNSYNYVEQFCFEENELLYDFNKKILDSIIEKFKTIDKSIKNEDNIEHIDDRFIKIKNPQFNKFNVQSLEIIDIKIAKVQFNTKCFKVFYNDNTSSYISYLMMIRNKRYNSEEIFYIAYRNSIHDDIYAVKQEYLDKNSKKGQVKCQETGKLSKWTELVVDHRQPNTFSIILDRFKEINRFDLEKIEYTANEKNQTIFKDNNLADLFKQYHKDKASLHIVRKECNSSRTGMGRVKKSSKDLTVK